MQRHLMTAAHLSEDMELAHSIAHLASVYCINMLINRTSMAAFF